MPRGYNLWLSLDDTPSPVALGLISMIDEITIDSQGLLRTRRPIPDQTLRKGEKRGRTLSTGDPMKNQ